MKFPYKKYQPGVLRPVIPVVVQNKDRFLGYEVLVDSGADFCIFPAEVGEYIGLNIESGEKREVFGITGAKEPYYVHQITIKVGGCAKKGIQYKIYPGEPHEFTSAWPQVMKSSLDFFKENLE